MIDAMAMDRMTPRARPERASAGVVAPFSMVTQSHPLWPSMAPLRESLEQAAAGECVAFAVPLDTPKVTRLLSLVTLRWQRRRAERAIRQAGGEVVAHFGVDPSLAQPSWFYELDTPASDYTDRFMRPKGSNLVLRRIAERCFGCDPALGGVLVVGKKPC